MPKNTHFFVKFEGADREMCCPGCEAVASSIIENGLSGFYIKRTAFAPQAEAVPSVLLDDVAYDGDSEVDTKESVEHSLIIEGITCSACIWLLEKHVQQLHGISSFSINYATRRALVKFDVRAIKLSQVLEAIRGIGYQAYPYDPDKQHLQLQQERKDFLSRLGVALFCGMQVMMITIGLYIAGVDEIEPSMLLFLKWVSAVFTVPVVLYAAKPFFRAALRDVKQLSPGMDVPVTLGITGAFIASVFNTYLQEGDTYYESVCMFVIFLLLARYIEFLTRWYAVRSSERITQATPMVATRIITESEFEVVSAKLLQIGDQVQINPGAVIPADAMIVKGVTTVDESIITGENEPVSKISGDTLLGGSHNIDSIVIAKVTRVGEESTLSTISRLVDRAYSEKPAWVQRADRFATLFVWGVVLLTGFTAWFGWSQGVDDWFSTTLSVLVVTCPCALSLATPTAYTAAMSALFERGVVVTQGNVLETLTTTQQVVFDKTGTLTQGSMRIASCQLLAGMKESGAFKIAASLERFSDHPIAKAFELQAELIPYVVSDVEHQNGAGLSGVINGVTYFLGSNTFIKSSIGVDSDTSKMTGTPVVLASYGQVIAIFEIRDVVRSGVTDMVAWLKHRKKSIALLSGDHLASVAWLAKKVGIDEYASNLSPDEKLTALAEFQTADNKVVMVGDGVNDAPVMAKADVSISVAGASQLARASSDILLLGDDMNNIQRVFLIADKTNSVIRQNMVWALVYNVGALPLAMMSYIEPWQAALGMSISSLVVVLNSFRLRLQGSNVKVTERKSGG